MAEQDRSKRLARVDAVVIAAVCLLLIVLVPVLFARPREQSMRRLCAANLGQIGKAMLVYAGENDGELPRAGGPNTAWGFTSNWAARDRRMVFGLNVDGSGGRASITASLYLLVKYYGAPMRLFVCKADKGTTEFKLSQRTDVPTWFEPHDAWDFGGLDESYRHCSYAYHIPYGLYGLSVSSDPNMAVAADRSPWIISPAAAPTVWAEFMPDRSAIGGTGTSEQARRGNSVTHQRDGQNVLFLDGRVAFERRSYCGVGKDNIYTASRHPTLGDPFGAKPVLSWRCSPTNRKDSLLVHDPDSFGGG